MTVPIADEQETLVVFRMDRKSKEVVAVFPMELVDYSGDLMGCYVHVGQHSTCAHSWYATTRRATEEECAPLKRELESEPYGYRFKVRLKVPSNAAQVRRDAARELRTDRNVGKEEFAK